jgi:hypothetical protein
MEADWEIEVGGDAPVIDACWTGFVDLRQAPERADAFVEVASLPGLAMALKILNSAPSPVWTAKCDVFPQLSAEEFNADELDCTTETAPCGAACYIDLLPRAHRAWSTPEKARDFCVQLCKSLAVVRLVCCRADLVIRCALTQPGQMGYGVTSYLTAGGPSHAHAARALESSLEAFARTVQSCPTLQ